NPRILKSGVQDRPFYGSLWKTISGGEVWRGHIVNKRKDGTLYTEDASISPVLDASRRVVNYVAVKRDITREAALEDQLRQSQKMEAVGRLAGGVAHDFNNMLQVINGHAETALEDIDKEHPLYETLGEIMKAGQRSANLTRQLLAFARKQTIAPKILDINEVIADMLKMLGRLIGEDIQLLFRCTGELGMVKMDPAQIDQILANLAVNARDAIKGVGTVTIETANVEIDEGYCIGHAEGAPGKYVMLTFSDTGCGMDKETQEKVFEPFFTTKPQGEGTGLGLATVYGIVKQNEGFVNLYSEPGQGTTFRIYFPRCEGVDAPREARKAALSKTGTETVLLVEDEETLLKLATMLLKRLGYTVLPANEPAKAIAIASEYGEKIHLLMTDMVMPGMNGRDLRDKLAPVRPSMKCLFMSGYTPDFIVHRGVLEAETHFIQKPFSLDDLATKVREVLES
ncbi:MAG: hypothetical protein QG656_615, partial [Candidatus Hydrogenedentes bacterium]|nr:hypothetical protein [Candidatus Hydrogenedentota bacterium]